MLLKFAQLQISENLLFNGFKQQGILFSHETTVCVCVWGGGQLLEMPSTPQSQGPVESLAFFSHIARCWQQCWPLNLRLRQEDRVGRREAVSASSDVFRSSSVDFGQDLFQGHYFRRLVKMGLFFKIPFLTEVCQGTEHIAGFLFCHHFLRHFCLLLNILG